MGPDPAVDPTVVVGEGDGAVVFLDRLTRVRVQHARNPRHYGNTIEPEPEALLLPRIQSPSAPVSSR